MINDTQYLTQESYDKLIAEKKSIKDEKIPEIAKKIDEAKQQGDLSENAEYHQAKDDMAWAQGRLEEIEMILDNAEIIDKNNDSKTIQLGSLVKVECNGKQKEYLLVGQQEADPLNGKISNDSPLGRALIGSQAKKEVKIKTPSGEQVYKILSVK